MKPRETDGECFMELTLNGEAYQTKAATITDLLIERAAPPRGIAVEVNGMIVPASQHQSHVLKAGDRVEVISFIGGG